MIRALFLCGKNRLRSPTAERVFSAWPGVEAASAGVGHDAEVEVTPEMVEWADVIFVMEEAHRRKLTAKLGKWMKGKRVVCLSIADEYGFMEPALVALLKERAGVHLR